MSKVKRLLDSYGSFIDVPWRDDVAPAQRVIFCVYPEYDELRLRACLDEFEIATRRSGHDWAKFDLTDSFAAWMASQKYAKSYFRDPATLATLLGKYEDDIASRFESFCTDKGVGEGDVVAVSGVGSLFGFLRVKGVVDRLAPMVPGRLVVFFPGSYEDNNYRLLDAYDGWGYLAIPITADQ
ncbi:BREX protein BrxB domain-containing protein [Botrimarina hoheduenensis]|uniref:BREX protein BrxB domain-containing protein n=1 Tax=Botrimarina hoheduenensis TaxID=2528000 RepID=UPI0011B61AFF|nr:BREX protein BrxB domain-containing protein [Botrimarina hoheduenensis]